MENFSFQRMFQVLFSKPNFAIPIAQHLAKCHLHELTGADALLPIVKEKHLKIMEAMKLKGKPMRLQEAFRSAKKQDTLSGSVTNAKGLQSYHQYCCSFDMVFVDYGYNPPSDSWWNDYGKEVEKQGMIWGGRWTTLVDKPHAELHEGWTWKDVEGYFKR